MKVQIICKWVTKRQVLEALGEFRLDDDRVQQRTNHVVIELDPDDRTDDVLLACRNHAYSYLRLTEWERGGGLERTGGATCIAGTQGQPLRPIVLSVGNERANIEHALFASRNGLVIARVQRQDMQFTVDVACHLVRGFRVQPARTLLHGTFTDSPRAWLEQLHASRIDLDQFIPVVRSALRKAECLFCSHCHYYEVSDQQEEDS